MSWPMEPKLPNNWLYTGDRALDEACHRDRIIGHSVNALAHNMLGLCLIIGSTDLISCFCLSKLVTKLEK
jgi:hypothetical protein